MPPWRGDPPCRGRTEEAQIADATAMSNESTSPTKKRLRVPVEDHDPMVSTKGLKKSEIKKIQKEQLRLEKKAAKEQEKAAIAERKRQRGA